MTPLGQRSDQDLTTELDNLRDTLTKCLADLGNDPACAKIQHSIDSIKEELKSRRTAPPQQKANHNPSKLKGYNSPFTSLYNYTISTPEFKFQGRNDSIPIKYGIIVQNRLFYG
ncbi:hypothetical protein NA971_21080 [Salmonella sp. NW189]|uniref:hypothetical protein n=1 Tax=Salmonella sp. NW189 TaxID=2947787 RepID=UPI003F41C017